MIDSVQANLWESILDRHSFDGKYFISMNTAHTKKTFFDHYKTTAMYENTLATLARISPEVILPVLVKNVTIISKINRIKIIFCFLSKQ